MPLNVVHGHDNGLYFFHGRTDVSRCESCNALIRKWKEDLSVVPVRKKIRFDVSCSYDGVKVVSPKFREVYEENKMFGLKFTELSNGYCAIMPERIVKFDAVTRKSRFENQCATCGNYESVVGAKPAFLVRPVNIEPLEFVRTDLEFASNDEKGPLIICGEAAGEILAISHLAGIDLYAVRE